MQIRKADIHFAQVICNIVANARPWTEREVMNAFGLVYRPTRHAFFEISWSPVDYEWAAGATTDLEKPRMWFCPVRNVYHCQRGYVRGTGTTRQYAYKQMREQWKSSR